MSLLCKSLETLGVVTVLGGAMMLTHVLVSVAESREAWNHTRSGDFCEIVRSNAEESQNEWRKVRIGIIGLKLNTLNPPAASTCVNPSR